MLSMKLLQVVHCNKVSVDDNAEAVDVDNHFDQQSLQINFLFQKTECLGLLKGKIMLRRRAVLT